MQSIGNTAAGIAAALTPWPSQKSSSNAALCNFFTGSEEAAEYLARSPHWAHLS
jgi:hypothetical protein